MPVSIPNTPSPSKKPLPTPAPVVAAQNQAPAETAQQAQQPAPPSPAPPPSDSYRVAEGTSKSKKQPRGKRLSEDKFKAQLARSKATPPPATLQRQAADPLPVPAPTPEATPTPSPASQAAARDASASADAGLSGFALAASAGGLPVPVGPPGPPVWVPGATGGAGAAAEGAAKVAAGGSRLAAAGGVAAAAAVLLYPGDIRPDQANPITGQPWPVPPWPKPIPELVEDWRKAGLLDPGKTGLPEFPPLPPGASSMQEYDWTRKLSPEQQAHLKDLYAQVQAGLKPEGANNWNEVRSYIGKPVADGIPKGYETYYCNGRTFLRRKDGNSDKFAQLTVDEKGLIQPGASQRLSQPGALERAMEKVGGPRPPGHQAHHTVPDAVVRDHPLFQAARTRGAPPYDLDSASNGAYLPETQADRARVPASKDPPLHNGCHPQYSDMAKQFADVELTKLVQQHGDIKNIPANKLAEAARKVEQAMQSLIKSWVKNHGDKLL
jgi:hypothetical protein